MEHRRILFCTAMVTLIITITNYTINKDVQGEEQPTNNSDSLETMIEQNNRIIQQNDETAIQDRAGAFIGVIALLISLSLVIYGFQLSREGRITQRAKRHYHIIILSLVVPVFILIAVAWFAIEEFLYPHYIIMISLLLIPGLIVIMLMFKGAIVGDESTPPTSASTTK